MRKGLTLTIRRVLTVTDEDDFEEKMEQRVKALEAAGWVVDTDANDEGSFEPEDGEDDPFDDEDEADPIDDEDDEEEIP
jgi:hypothetical protein